MKKAAYMYIIVNIFFLIMMKCITAYFLLTGGLGLLGDCWMVGLVGGLCGLSRNPNAERASCNDK